MKWPSSAIACVCHETAIRDPTKEPSQRFRYVDISSIDRDQKSIVSAAEILGSEAPSRARKEIRSGDILVSTVRPGLNATAMVPDYLDGQIASTGFCVLRPDERYVVGRYLFYYCITTRFIERLCVKTRGAHYPAVSDSEVKSLCLPLPPVSEQRRIVEILDQADALRKLRAEADAKAERILPALFYKMFGDPATNPMGWPVGRLSDLAQRFSDGPFGSNLKTSHYTEDGIRVVRLQNIGVGEFLDDDKAFIDPEHFETLSNHECLPGDVLVGTLGDPNLRACVLPDHIPRALNKADCVQIRPKLGRATAEYVCWLLNVPSTLIMAARLIHGQTRTRISMGLLRDLIVPLPPFALQGSFGRAAREISRQRAAQRRAKRLMANLFQTLLHRAFSGDLTAKWRQAHMQELLEEMESQARTFNNASVKGVKAVG